jgi:ribosomal protein L11 methylase PrmA
MEQMIIEGASFRDPSGFVFRHNGTLYRQINSKYKDDYEHLRSSGLYDKLVSQGLMLAHDEVENFPIEKTKDAWKIIEPEPLKFVSYPYEWSILHFRGAALTTLRIAKLAMEYGMILKDASAYNMQFHKGRWCLIDTLSFERYNEGKPWVAYKQFCQHFLSPLALLAYGDQRLGLLSRVFIDGIPLDIASKLLPFRTNLRFGLLTHIHLHSRSQKQYADRAVREDINRKFFTKQSMKKLVESLRQTVKSINVDIGKTEWENYYEITNYSRESFETKKGVVDSFIDLVKPDNVWDLGANTGEFSRIASEKGIFTVAFDIDPGAVVKNYLQVRKDRDENLIPLIVDLTNPSPNLGWAHQERQSLIERGPVDLALALALVHHLAISNNVPLEKIASFFKSICKHLIIEFIPKSDSQVSRLLQTRRDIFVDYHKDGFEKAFERYFEIKNQQSIVDSERIIYLMKVK